MRRLLLAALLLWLGSVRADEILSAAPSEVQITIYRDLEAGRADDFEDLSTGLAMVNETRTVELPAGESTLVFRGVAHVIVPQTAALEGMPGVVLEINYDHDLLSPGAIAAKSVGQSVRVVRTNRATGSVTEQRAVLRSGPDGLVLDINGRIEALNCSGLAEKLIFDEIPPGLTESPTLSIRVRVERAGGYTLKLSYLSLGLYWSADYLATINADGRTLDLAGWITLTNHTGTMFENAPTEVVAGELERTRDETQAPPDGEYPQSDKCWPIGSFVAPKRPSERAQPIMQTTISSEAIGVTDSLEEAIVTGIRASVAQMSELGDYKLYRVPEPTTVAARQSKQVLFLNQQQIPFERLYTYRLDLEALDSDELSHSPITTLRLVNKQNRHLGKPLPAGTMSVYESGSSSFGKVLAGEDTVKDTPVGLPLDVEIGRAMDIWIEPRQVAERTIERPDEDTDQVEAQLEIRFANDKPTPVVIEYRQPLVEDLQVIR
ncbi:MAG TPA: hypothetical protein VFS24_21675, partial [Steroidobacteraceae bacterium]|nr:hypothetical protein [Steroidobacteraceae bacterium]